MDFVVHFDAHEYMDLNKHKLRNAYIYMDLIVNADADQYMDLDKH